MHSKTASRLSVALVAYDGLSLLEFAVACDVFGDLVDSPIDVPWYRMRVCSENAAPVITDRGMRLEIGQTLAAVSRADIVVVPPSSRLDDVPATVLTALRRAHRRGARIVSLCTGAFVQAAAGLLDGRRVTTHWGEADELVRRYPAVTVDPSVLYIDDGDILTSAGSAASIDLCLHVVRCDYGSETAAELARDLVVAPHRDGGQAQFIRTPVPEPSANDLFADTVAWMQAHLDQDVDVEQLADRAVMSRRTFARRFADSMGTTPYQWLLRQRVDLAQRLLETTQLPIDAVAHRSGFGTATNLRKHFARIVHTSPAAYRRAFTGAPAEAV